MASAPQLAYSLVAPSGPSPTRWILFLHGIFGTGGNWRTMARRLIEHSPGWGAVLCDLRVHGGSQGFGPPHTLASAAADLTALDAQVPGPIRAVAGHSFGGKVALEYFARRAERLDHVVVLDSAPGPRPEARGSEQTVAVLEILRASAGPFASREAFQSALGARGLPGPIVQWLAMNLRRIDDGVYVFGVDLDAVDALLDDYFARDLWPLLEQPPGTATLDIVIGDRSPVFLPEDRARLAEIAARSMGRVRSHVLVAAGHWVQVDDPEGVLTVLRAALGPREPTQR